MNNIYLSIAILLLLGISAFFSATETAFSSANSVRLKNLKKHSGSVGHITAIKVLEGYDNFLSTVLIGNNIATLKIYNVGSGVTASVECGGNISFISCGGTNSSAYQIIEDI